MPQVGDSTHWLGLLTLIIMTSLWKLLSLPRVLSLRIKRFRAVSGQRTRNESQRSKNRASKRAGGKSRSSVLLCSEFTRKSLLHRLSDPPPLHVFCLISTKTTIVVISYEDVFRVSSLVPSRCAKIVPFLTVRDEPKERHSDHSEKLCCSTPPSKLSTSSGLHASLFYNYKWNEMNT